LSYCFAWSYSWHSICGPATVHHFYTCYASIIAHPGTLPEAFI
jgi:hypothetical protein